jgi:hypothetical protein
MKRKKGCLGRFLHSPAAEAWVAGLVTTQLMQGFVNWLTEGKKQSHAKAQRRKGAKKTTKELKASSPLRSYLCAFA